MSATDRIQSEQAFHDGQARDRAGTFRRQPSALVFDEDAYLDHESWIRPGLEQLGDVYGCQVLDLGCGHGMAAIVLARRGARVTALELSHGYLQEARDRAQAHGVAIDFLQADGHHLPIADHSFDCIWGNAVLHHLDIDVAARELCRVMRPGGRAVFCEPWGENPLLNWARRRLPYPGKARTVDEQPLQRRHVEQLRAVFSAVEVRGFQLLGMARRLMQSGAVVAGCDWCDARLLSRVPALQRFCRYVVLALRP